MLARKRGFGVQYWRMRPASLLACVVGFMIANTSAVILFKLTAQNAGRKALWYFVLGNLVGFFGPVTLTLALKLANPNVVYALCYGGAFALFQIISWRLFQQPLSSFQWAGIVCVGIGTLLLQVRG